MNRKNLLVSFRIGFVTFLLFFLGICVDAQSYSAPSVTPNKDVMLSNDKIFVVMAVVVVILLGLFIYLFSLDRKISKLEKLEKH